jgi:hypothetical protein
VLINSGTQPVVAATFISRIGSNKAPALGAIFRGAAVTSEALHH